MVIPWVVIKRGNEGAGKVQTSRAQLETTAPVTARGDEERPENRMPIEQIAFARLSHRSIISAISA
jgi:hypothetical protein